MPFWGLINFVYLRQERPDPGAIDPVKIFRPGKKFFQENEIGDPALYSDEKTYLPLIKAERLQRVILA